MMALSRVPESWGFKSVQSEKAPLLLHMAREAIEKQLEQDTAEVAQQLERTRQAYTQQHEQQEADRKNAEIKKQALSFAIDQADSKLRAAPSELPCTRTICVRCMETSDRLLLSCSVAG
jgi:hypothetical protein